jgi:hypothetical protein
MKMMTREELMAKSQEELVQMIFDLVQNKGVCGATGECGSDGKPMDGGKMGSCKTGGSCKS